MAYFIYKALYYSLNESAERNNGTMYAKDCKSLDLLCRVEGEFDEAYHKMKEFGNALIQEGWELLCVSRSKNYGNDNYGMIPEGKGDRDALSADIIYSTTELALRTR